MDAVHVPGIFDWREQETRNWYRQFKGVTALGIWYAGMDIQLIHP